MAQITPGQTKKSLHSTDWKIGVAQLLATKLRGVRKVDGGLNDSRINAQIAGQKLSTHVAKFWTRARLKLAVRRARDSHLTAMMRVKVIHEILCLSISRELLQRSGPMPSSLKMSLRFLPSDTGRSWCMHVLRSPDTLQSIRRIGRSRKIMERKLPSCICTKPYFGNPTRS